jgi:hypothetical protein
LQGSFEAAKRGAEGGAAKEIAGTDLASPQLLLP